MEGLEIGKIITQFGFAGLIFVAFMFLLKWVLKQQETILEDSKAEREISNKTIQTFQISIAELSATNKDSHDAIGEAHKYQRDEHIKMMEGLNNITNAATNNTNCLEKIKENLQEQGNILVRINGFKKE
jgi:hypothetical protein